jgi:hypothetical protein
MKKAILIDVENQKIDFVQVPTTNVLKEIYTFIGCDLMECATYIEDDALMVDEEGRLKEGIRMFYLEGYGVIYGNGLIIGNGADGEIDDCTIPLKEIQDNVTFLNDIQCDMIRLFQDYQYQTK